jgi:hypothetical protein
MQDVPDYRPILLRALSKLALNTVEARQEVYRRARSALQNVEGHSALHLRALEAAIFKVEMEASGSNLPARVALTTPSLTIEHSSYPAPDHASFPQSAPSADHAVVRDVTDAASEKRHRFRDFASSLFGILIFVALLTLPTAFIWGTEWVSARIIPYLVQVALIVFGLCILVLGPLSIFRGTRPVSMNGFVLASYLFGITTWLFGFIAALNYWGWIAVFVGLFLGVVGVVPIGAIASALNSDWDMVGILVIGLVLTYGARSFGLFLASTLE